MCESNDERWRWNIFMPFIGPTMEAKDVQVASIFAPDICRAIWGRGQETAPEDVLVNETRRSSPCKQRLAAKMRHLEYQSDKRKRALHARVSEWRKGDDTLEEGQESLAFQLSKAVIVSLSRLHFLYVSRKYNLAKRSSPRDGCYWSLAEGRVKACKDGGLLVQGEFSITTIHWTRQHSIKKH